MINTIFYFPESLTYDQYLNVLDKESEDGIASRTIVLAKRQNMIYNNGAIFGSIPGLVNYEEFADTISTLNLALEGKANASEYLPLSGGTITGRLITEGSLNAQGKVNVSNQLSITSSSGPEDDPEYYQFTLENGVINIDDSTVIDRDSVTSDKFVKNGGTSAEFLKADGSVDSNAYLTEHQELKTINNQSLIGEGNITIEDNQIQTDWNQTDTTKVDYIKNKPTIPTVPTNVSAFNNDAGYLTEHQDISNKADKATTLEGYGITDGYTKTEGQTLESDVNSRLYAQDTTINNRMDQQEDMIELLNGSEVIVVDDHTAVVSPDTQKIYREPNIDPITTEPVSYTDWMCTDDTIPTWKAIATYDFPGIDDEPTADSDNLVKSGGVAAVNGYYTEDSKWAEIVVDADRKIIRGTKQNGDTYSHNLHSETLDALSKDINDINTELANKVDKVENKDLIDSDFSESLKTANDPYYAEATVDSNDKILEARQVNGDKSFFTPVDIQGVKEYVEDDDTWIYKLIDKNGTFIAGISNDKKIHGDLAGIEEVKEAIAALNGSIATNVTFVNNYTDWEKTSNTECCTKNLYPVIAGHRYVIDWYDSAKIAIRGLLFTSSTGTGSEASTGNSCYNSFIDIPSGVKYIKLIVTKIGITTQDCIDADIKIVDVTTPAYHLSNSILKNKWLKEGSYPQGMAISNDYVFQAFANGTIEVRDFNSGQLLDTLNVPIPSGSTSHMHCGNLVFGPKQNESDEFGLLWIASDSIGSKMLACKIERSNTNFSINSVYEISAPSIDTSLYNSITQCYDFITNKMAQITYHNDGNGGNGDVHIFIYDVSSWDSNAQFTLSSDFKVSKMWPFQSGIYQDDRLYIVAGTDRVSARIYVFNVIEKQLEYIVDLRKPIYHLDILEELQSIAFYNNDIYISTNLWKTYPNDAYCSLYQITF